MLVSLVVLDIGFVPQDGLAGQFGGFWFLFCLESLSFETIQLLSNLVLSRITLFRDNSVALQSRFVPNHPLSGQFSCSPISFCLESLSFGTVQMHSALVLSRITLFRNSSDALHSRFVPNHPDYSYNDSFSLTPLLS
jgi:hypothetical protein